MYHLGLVALGGAIGASFRHLVNVLALRLLGPGFPVGTLSVNVLGGFLMGGLAGFLALRYQGGGQGLRLFLGTGILGGFTTFSAFSLEAATMIERGDVAMAAAYAVSSVAGSVMMLFIGLWLVRAGA